jgi:hypothetical protein
MRLSDFILLSEEEKKRVVLHEGVLVGKRDNNRCKVFLFQMENYYVEMYCNRQSKTVESYYAFQHTRLLRPYLPTIPFDDLLH